MSAANAKAILHRGRINGDALGGHRSARLSERYLAERLGIGLRTRRRSFLDERGVTAYVALRQLRLPEAQRRLATQPVCTENLIRVDDVMESPGGMIGLLCLVLGVRPVPRIIAASVLHEVADWMSSWLALGIVRFGQLKRETD